MAKAAYEYPPDVSFRDAARIALESSFQKMIDNVGGTRSGVERREPTPEEIEALHDMRVGTRRLRSALAVFAKVFSKSEFREIDKEVGAVTDALGAVRDLDVQLDALRALQAAAPENEAYGISRLVHHQTERREVERKALLVALERMEKDRFERRFQRVLDRALPKEEAKGETEGGAADG